MFTTCVGVTHVLTHATHESPLADTVESMRYVITGAIAVTLLAGCSSGSGHKDNVQLQAVNGHPDPDQLARLFNCSGYAASEDGTTMFAATSGSCDLGDLSVSIDTFANSDAESKYQKIADGVGKVGNIIYGDRWAIQTDNADQAAQIQQTTGGEIH